MDPDSLEEGTAILRRPGSSKRTQARKRQRQRAKERAAAAAKEDAAQDKRAGFTRQIFKENERKGTGVGCTCICYSTCPGKKLIDIRIFRGHNLP